MSAIIAVDVMAAAAIMVAIDVIVETGTGQAPLSPAPSLAASSGGAAATAIPERTINAIASTTVPITRRAAIIGQTIMVDIHGGIIVTQTVAITADTATVIQTAEPATLYPREAIGMGVQQRLAVPCATTAMAKVMSSPAVGI